MKRTVETKFYKMILKENNGDIEIILKEKVSNVPTLTRSGDQIVLNKCNDSYYVDNLIVQRKVQEEVEALEENIHKFLIDLEEEALVIN